MIWQCFHYRFIHWFFLCDHFLCVRRVKHVIIFLLQFIFTLSFWNIAVSMIVFFFVLLVLNVVTDKVCVKATVRICCTGSTMYVSIEMFLLIVVMRFVIVLVIDVMIIIFVIVIIVVIIEMMIII